MILRRAVGVLLGERDRVSSRMSALSSAAICSWIVSTAAMSDVEDYDAGGGYEWVVPRHMLLKRLADTLNCVHSIWKKSDADVDLVCLNLQARTAAFTILMYSDGLQ